MQKGHVYGHAEGMCVDMCIDLCVEMCVDIALTWWIVVLYSDDWSPRHAVMAYVVMAWSHTLAWSIVVLYADAWSPRHVRYVLRAKHNAGNILVIMTGMLL